MGGRRPISEGQMRCKVKVAKSKLDYFRRLARNTDLEIEAYLIGEVISPELTVIDEIAYTKKYMCQTTENVQWYQEDVDKVRAKAEERGKKLIGTIHSHPNYWPIVSGTDHKAHVTEQFRIIGVCATMNRKTKVCFWITESCLPCEIIYAT
jgi:proteasome lid subunit RPN8/RPN11